MQKLIETIDFTGCEFLEADGQMIAKNVVMLGPVSSHGYEYKQEAMSTAVKGGLYDGVRIFINHAKEGRDLMHLAGVFKNPRHEGGKIRGDAHLLDDDYGRKFWNIAKNMPEAAGCSHVADGKIVTEGGKRYVEQISAVHSVDLVVQGATTKAVFEGESLEESVPKPHPKERQFEFVDRCTREMQTANPSLSGDETMAACFCAWQARYEPSGMMADTDPVPAPATAKESATTTNTQTTITIETGPKPGKESPMTLAEKLKEYDAKKIAITSMLTADPGRLDIIREHQREEDHADFLRRQEEAKKTVGKAPQIAELALKSGGETGDELLQRMHESGRRQDETQRRAKEIAESSLPVGGGLVE